MEWGIISKEEIEEVLRFPYDQFLYVMYKEEEKSINGIERILNHLGINITGAKVADHMRYFFEKGIIRTRKQIYELQSKRHKEKQKRNYK